MCLRGAANQKNKRYLKGEEQEQFKKPRNHSDMEARFRH